LTKKLTGYLKIALTSSLNIIKMISHTSWGGDERVLIKIHRQLVKAKLDYGATIFQSTKINHQKIINASINTSTRLAIRAFRSSPIECIQNLALKPPSQVIQIEKTQITQQINT